MPVREISNDSLNGELTAAGDKLVLVDFFATWLEWFPLVFCQLIFIFRCGPCKTIAPFIDQLSNQYPNAVFLKADVEKCTVGMSVALNFHVEENFYRLKRRNIPSLPCRHLCFFNRVRKSSVWKAPVKNQLNRPSKILQSLTNKRCWICTKWFSFDWICIGFGDFCRQIWRHLLKKKVVRLWMKLINGKMRYWEINQGCLDRMKMIRK